MLQLEGSHVILTFPTKDTLDVLLDSPPPRSFELTLQKKSERGKEEGTEMVRVGNLSFTFNGTCCRFEGDCLHPESGEWTNIEGYWSFSDNTGNASYG